MASDVILYDLHVSTEWIHDTFVSANADQAAAQTFLDVVNYVTSTVQGSVTNVVNAIRPPAPLPRKLLALEALRSPWHIALAPQGDQVAILCTSHVEVRSVDAPDAPPRLTVSFEPSDPFPQHCRVAWSLDAAFLAWTTTSGGIFASQNTAARASPDAVLLDSATPHGPISALCFVSPRQESHLAELVHVDFACTLRTAAIVRGAGLVNNALPSFELSPWFDLITALLYDAERHILVVSGQRSVGTPLDAKPFVAFRVVRQTPFLVALAETDSRPAASPSLLSRLSRSVRRRVASELPDTIISASLSPDGRAVATVSEWGAVTVWNVASGDVRRLWSADILHDTDAPPSPSSVALNPTSSSHSQQQNQLHQLASLVPPERVVQVTWWNATSLVVTRLSGATTVCSVDESVPRNLLGADPEVLSRGARTASTGSAIEGTTTLFALEHERRWARFNVVTQSMEPVEDSLNASLGDHDVHESALRRVWNRALQFMALHDADAEDARPRRISIFRLICVQSASPDEMFRRRVDAGEYGLALQLAKVYRLDKDLVYHHQWRSQTVSQFSIDDCLAKVADDHWVMAECINNVPDEASGVRMLLLFGLERFYLHRWTDLCLDAESDLRSHSDDGEDDKDEEEKKKKKKQLERARSMLLDSTIARVTGLDMDVREFTCNARDYLHRLATYEAICDAVNEPFDAKAFSRFRIADLLTLARTYAQEELFDALHVLFTFHPHVLLPHRLELLSLIPETSLLALYESLLPRCDNAATVQPWPSRLHAHSLYHVGRAGRGTSSSLLREALEAYEEHVQQAKHDGILPSLLTVERVQQWYIERARAIDEFSGRSDQARQLLEFATRNRVSNVADELLLLTQLCVCVYDRVCPITLTLSDFRLMSASERAAMLLHDATPETIAADASRLVVVDGAPEGFQLFLDFLVGVAQHHDTDADGKVRRSDTRAVELLLACLRQRHKVSVFPDDRACIHAILAVVHACESSEAHALIATQLLSLMPSRDPHVRAPDYIQLHERLRTLVQRIDAVATCARHAVPCSVARLAAFVEATGDAEGVRALLVRLTRAASRARPVYNAKKWMSLAEDMERVRRCTFCNETPLVSSGECRRVFLEGALACEQDAVLAACRPLVQAEGMAAVEVCVKAAQEYLNAATSDEHLLAQSIAYACTCLALAESTVPKEDVDKSRDYQDEDDDSDGETAVTMIARERRLHSAIALLRSTGAAIEPLRVRLARHVGVLVEQAVVLGGARFTLNHALQLSELLADIRPSDSSPPMRQSSLLRLSRGHALVAFATACQHHQSDRRDEALEACLKIIRETHADGWAVCSEVGRSTRDSTVTRQLVGFAVAHCPPAKLDASLRAFALATQSGHGDDSERTHHLVQQWHRQAREDNVGAPLLWCERMVEPPAPTETAERKAVDDARIALNTTLFRAWVQSTDDTVPIAPVLLELAADTVNSDTALSLAYLFSLPDGDLAEAHFKRLPDCEATYRLAGYYHAVCASNRQDVRRSGDIYRCTPVRQVIENSLTCAPSQSREHAMRYHALLNDTEKAGQLRSLSTSLDARLFTHDPSYRRQAVASLARTLDADRLATLISLVHATQAESQTQSGRDDLAPFDIYCDQLVHIFGDTQFTSAHNDALTRSREHLLARSKDLIAHLVGGIFPCLCATDLSATRAFFRLLVDAKTRVQVTHGSGDGDIGVGGELTLHAEAHLKALKAFGNALPVDYRALVADPSAVETLLPTIVRVATDDSIRGLAKAVSLVPRPSGSALSASQVIAQFVLVHLVQADGLRWWRELGSTLASHLSVAGAEQVARTALQSDGGVAACETVVRDLESAIKPFSKRGWTSFCRACTGELGTAVPALLHTDNQVDALESLAQQLAALGEPVGRVRAIVVLMRSDQPAAALESVYLFAIRSLLQKGRPRDAASVLAQLSGEQAMRKKVVAMLEQTANDDDDSSAQRQSKAAAIHVLALGGDDDARAKLVQVQTADVVSRLQCAETLSFDVSELATGTGQAALFDRLWSSAGTPENSVLFGELVAVWLAHGQGSSPSVDADGGHAVGDRFARVLVSVVASERLRLRSQVPANTLSEEQDELVRDAMESPLYEVRYALLSAHQAVWRTAAASYALSSKRSSGETEAEEQQLACTILERGLLGVFAHGPHMRHVVAHLARGPSSRVPPELICELVEAGASQAAAAVLMQRERVHHLLHTRHNGTSVLALFLRRTEQHASTSVELRAQCQRARASLQSYQQ